ncbi:MAG TPA: hypothetical protein VMM92_13895 [Thermoanaerobaculia bacterium]|nr:hypothetical protein [Thermoanaerobaculia bacterium]
MEETPPRVVKLPVALTGDYLKLNQLMAKYCNDFWSGHNVQRNLMIGQALGLPAPDHWGHASQSGGSGGEGERAAKNQQHYNDWFGTHAAALADVTVVEGGSSGGGNRGLYDPSLHDKKVAAKQQKQKARQEEYKGSHADEHVEKGDTEVDWAQNAWFCKQCGKMFV